VGINSNTWYHLRIDFECDTGGFEGLSADTYYVYLNGVRYGPYNFASGVDNLDKLRISTHDTQTGYNNYIDALGYSWDSDYNVGDNLNEGLLLSYENSYAMDWQAYSLDGLTNKTILGNTTIPLPIEGTHTIQVFGNNSLGTMEQSDLNYFSVNFLPILNINSPDQSEIYGVNAPNFNISIIESFLNETWYTLDNGASNITFTGFTGTINPAEWAKQTDGLITIKFYANDTSGLENFSEVIVIKDTSIPIINIFNPIGDEFFGSIPPSFSVSLIEPSLNTTWYTLDGGVSNVTFTGLTGTINQIEWDKEIEGSISIRFYANDTFGNINYAEILVYKDITDPILTVHSPSFGSAFTIIPPVYNVSVEELNLDSMWYTIDDGLNNYTLLQSTGNIYSAAWNTAPIGAITIRFYVKDMAGNTVFEDIIIQKNAPPQPPNYTLIIIVATIGSIVGISAIGVIVYNKKYKAARKIRKQEVRREKHFKMERARQEKERLRRIKQEQERTRREKLENERIERERVRRDKLKQERLEQERREQERLRKLEEEARRVEEEARKAERETFEKIRKIMNVSSRIKMDLVRKYIKMDQNTFDSKIIDWATQFGFTIDGDYLNIQKENVSGFIDELERQFSQWRKDEQGRESKS
jgi:hypothetical protein